MSHLTVLADLDQGTDEWLEARRGMITASTVGRLITPKTLKPANNPESRSLTLSLAAERISGWVEPSFVTSDMWRGIEHEPKAREAYAEWTHAEVTQVGFMIRDYGTHRIGYSPDGLVGDVGLIEIKCPRAKSHVATILEDRVPGQYMPQLQCGLLVSGRAWIDFVSFCAGMPLWVKRVYPDPAWAAVITEASQQFEQAAAQMVADYTAKVAGLPTTERITDLEIVI